MYTYRQKYTEKLSHIYKKNYLVCYVLEQKGSTCLRVKYVPASLYATYQSILELKACMNYKSYNDNEYEIY